MIDIPIFICIKEHSVRCPGKNFELLPYTLNYLQKNNYIQNTVVISDSDIFKSITNNYNIKNYFIEQRDTYWDELYSCYNYCNQIKYYDNYIILNVTQPLRELNLIDKCLDIDLKICDLVTSYTIIPERSIFYLDDNNQFVIKNSERKGCMCHEQKVADGAIYYTSYRFMTTVINSDNPNKTFWNSNIYFIENNVPFVDIDTPNDLNIFKQYFK